MSAPSVCRRGSSAPPPLRPLLLRRSSTGMMKEQEKWHEVIFLCERDHELLIARERDDEELQVCFRRMTFREKKNSKRVQAYGNNRTVSVILFGYF
jgi:hypothetical protein